MPATHQSQKRQRQYKTATSVITDAELTRVRAAAHRYLMAGGSIFLDNGGDTDRDEHVANVRGFHSQAASHFARLLEQLLPSGPQAPSTHRQHEDLYAAAWRLISATSDAAYLFGVCVGMEVAALTIHGELPRVVSRRKGGAR